MMEAAAERFRRAHNDRAWLAWTGAALARARCLPKLKTLQIAGRAKPLRPQTAEERMATYRQWAAATSRPVRAR